MMVQNTTEVLELPVETPNRGCEKGYCAVANCEHLEMELLHKCDTCKLYAHVLCMMVNDLLILEEGGSSNDYYCSLLCKR
jgi:hypothetical protein